jgi:hypothetical protein
MVDHPPLIGNTAEKTKVDDAAEHKARRDFLIRCGRFAVVTPPMMTTLLAVSTIPEEAHASTIGRRSPGKSGKSPRGFAFGLFDD